MIEGLDIDKNDVIHDLKYYGLKNIIMIWRSIYYLSVIYGYEMHLL